MSRVVNFNAGPAALPLPALERAQSELIDYKGTGTSFTGSVQVFRSRDHFGRSPSGTGG